MNGITAVTYYEDVEKHIKPEYREAAKKKFPRKPTIFTKTITVSAFAWWTQMISTALVVVGYVVIFYEWVK